MSDGHCQGGGPVILEVTLSGVAFKAGAPLQKLRSWSVAGENSLLNIAFGGLLKWRH
jgi:hypothetical protein